MANVRQSVPPGVAASVIYGCSGPRQSGVSFQLRLPFTDETHQPPVAGQFDREWVVSRHELDEAERLGRSDLVLLGRRDREERAFLEDIERRLRRERLQLERVGKDLVLRRAGS